MRNWIENWIENWVENWIENWVENWIENWMKIGSNVILYNVVQRCTILYLG